MHQKKVVLSIIIPTLNEEKRIEKILNNIKGRIKSLSYEIIISDGNSADSTVKIAERYADKIEVYRGRKRQTIAGGRNLGAKRANGEFLVFLDADVSIPSPDRFFLKAVGNFKKNQKLAALTVNIRVLPENESLADKIVYVLLNNYHRLVNNIIHIGIASGEFQMIKSSSFRKVKGYNESLVASEDYEMFMRLSKIGRTKIDNSLTAYHTGRRARKVGWPRLLFTWTSNSLGMLTLKRSTSKEWEVVR